MPDQNRPTCPITGRPLPDGHTIHPSLAAEVHDQANRIAAIIPETMKHTPPTHTSGARTQPTPPPPAFKPSKPSPNSYTKTRANNSTKPHTARPPQPGTKSRAPYTKTPAASRKPQTPPPPTPKPRAY